MARQAVVTNATLVDFQRSADGYPQDGSGEGVFAEPYAGDNSANNLQRPVAVFALPEGGEPGYRVTDATFSCVMKLLQNNGGNLPDLDVAFLDKGVSTAVAGSDYHTAALASLAQIATPATAGDTTLTWSNQDLADAIDEAYLRGSTHIAIRFQLALTGDFYDGVNGYAVSDADAANDYYRLYYGDAVQPDPTLQISLVADPRPFSTGTFTEFQRIVDGAPQNGTGDGVFPGSYCGDIVSGNFMHAVLTFALPELGSDRRVDQAVLHVSLDSVANNGGNLVDLDVAFAEKGITGVIAADDYQAAAVTELASIATPDTAADSILNWSSQALTDAINAAYLHGSDYVMFRFQFAKTGDFYDGVNGYAVTDGDGQLDLYYLENSDPVPELLLYEYVDPDPRPVSTGTLTEFRRIVDGSPQNGTGDNDFAGTSCGDIFNENMQKVAATFQLPALGKGRSVDEAVFRTTLILQNNNGGNLVDLDVAFVEKGASGAIVAGDYEAAATASLASIADPETRDNMVLYWTNQDLTDALNAAYENGNTYVMFRFQLAETGDFYDSVNGYATSDGDGADDQYDLDNDPAPELVIYQYVPPNGSVILLR
ncbi:MAG: hypothetical protein JW951_08700 [Lentisphaerae bacterium]|nr:hypothetical protein [Lentisphaerota bacterium]